MEQEIEIDLCRKCRSSTETIDYIIFGCATLSSTEYLDRHNLIRKIIQQALAKKHCTQIPQPSPVKEDENATMYWDTQVITHRTVNANKPNIVVVNWQNTVIAQTRCTNSRLQ
uniref:Uncharacterized protein n=1 Tax=Glossina palpalis gambiensis TaxID=67801 RepID=A0A1B0BPZ3_9MUSC